jgi:heptosyltransferase-2
MKRKSDRLHFFDLYYISDFASTIIFSILDLFFFTIRFFNKLISYKSGNVIVISLHRLGDTVFTIPAIREIKRHYQKKLTIVCFPESIPIYNISFLDVDFHSLDREDFILGNRIATFKARRMVKSLKPEIIIDLIGGSTSASIIYNLRAKEVVGVSNKKFKAIYDHYVEIRKSPKLIDIYLDAILPVIKFKNQEIFQEPSVSSNANGEIVIHPLAGWKEKEWSLKKYFQLATLLNEDFNVKIVVPSNYLIPDIDKELEYQNLQIIRTNNVDELIDLIKDCSLFIGNDSGPVNIANHLGKATFTIYGATNPDYTAPTAKHQIYIRKLLNCSARQDEKFCMVGGDAYRCSGVECMDKLTIKEVYSQLEPLLIKYCNRVKQTEFVK